MSRLHIVGLPHTETTAEFCACAYTSKIVKGCRMFMEAGHEVYLYAGETNEAPCTEHVTIVKRSEQQRWFGTRASHEQFPNVWDTGAAWWSLLNKRTVREVKRRVQPRDLVLILGGVTQQGIARGIHALDAEVIEWGVGYEGVWTRARAYESYSHMHLLYGKHGHEDGRVYDAVIHNFFDPDSFPRENAGGGDYLLYMGRIVRRKGLEYVARAAEETGIPLVIAGQGATRWGDGWVESPEIGLRGNLEYVGAVGEEDRNELMAGAVALLAPTLYVEPFGGVAVEAQMCGTPAITTDWGAFPETVDERWRGRTLADFCDAIEDAATLKRADHRAIRAAAVARFSLEAIAPKYDRWFKRIYTLWGTGWDDLSERHERKAA